MQNKLAVSAEWILKKIRSGTLSRASSVLKYPLAHDAKTVVLARNQRARIPKALPSNVLSAKFQELPSHAKKQIIADVAALRNEMPKTYAADKFVHNVLNGDGLAKVASRGEVMTHFWDGFTKQAGFGSALKASFGAVRAGTVPLGGVAKAVTSAKTVGVGAGRVAGAVGGAAARGADHAVAFARKNPVGAALGAGALGIGAGTMMSGNKNN